MRSQGARLPLLLLLALNAVPLVGVFAWGWQSFDLIFLYWMENVVIGVFTLARMIVRPYAHPIDFFFPGFIVPFFALHYGMFCFGHGTFVLSMFGPDGAASGAGEGLLAMTLGALDSLPMLLALAALALLQLLDWVQDVRERGLGADGIKVLMVKPYRRIVVLHLTIIVGGFALAALDEPTVGLLILVVLKTASDVWHWRHEHGAGGAETGIPMPTAEQLAAVAAQYPEPVVTVNGREKRFRSFREMKESREFRMAQAVMRMAGAASELKVLSAYLDQRIAEETASTDA